MEAKTNIDLVLLRFGPFLKATVNVSFTCLGSKNVFKKHLTCKENILITLGCKIDKRCLFIRI